MMRRTRPIDMLIPRTRQGILAATLLSPDRWCYLSELARRLAVPASSLQREVRALTAAGILRARRDGNRVYYQPDPACPFFPELRGLIMKTVGLADVLRTALAPVEGQIKSAFVYGSIARAEEVSTSDIDLMVIGNASLRKLSSMLAEPQVRLGRDINPTVYTRAALEKKLATGHHFLRNVLSHDKIFIVGGRDELERAAGLETGP